MRRQSEHNHDMRLALIAAAERLIAEEGPAALSVRAVAGQVGTTTQAVYTLFGSKDGLINALALRLYEMFGTAIAEQPETDDPAADLIELAVTMRRLVLEHPSLYRIAFQRVVPGVRAAPDLAAARQADLAEFRHKFERLEHIGLLAGESIEGAMLQFSAMVEGFANVELRGDALRLLPWGGEEQAWRDAAATLIRGFASSPALAGRRPRRQALKTR
jgi:AcrR family transcriptional regulator